ncbi:MAG: hypothetical protein VZR09_09130 [Candidatus Gastranaerophilaceae bacterium]|nr:hypothetical protein [Candidatus Gastranaerophilaceae bacterium]
MDNKLQNLLNRDDCYFIHYASSGFYNGLSSAPKISCIVIYNLKNDKGYRFNIADNLKGNSKEQAEKLTLENFKSVFTKIPNVSFIHWNMTANSFGFKAIQARAGELGVELPVIPEDNLFDLSSYIAYIAGKKLSIKQILWFNSLLYGDDFLDGKTEAEYLEKGKYEEIYNSIELKVKGFAEIVDLIKDNKLKTEPLYRNDDGLTKKERHREAVKRSQMSEQMLHDIMEHNKSVMGKSESEQVEEDVILYYNSEHPILSLIANWFANR